MAYNRRSNNELGGFFDDPIGTGRVNRPVRMSGSKVTTDRTTIIKQAHQAREERREIKLKYLALERILNFWRKQKKLRELCGLNRTFRKALIVHTRNLISEVIEVETPKCQTRDLKKLLGVRLLSCILSVTLLYNHEVDCIDLIHVIDLLISVKNSRFPSLMYDYMSEDVQCWNVAYETLWKTILSLIIADYNNIICPTEPEKREYQFKALNLLIETLPELLLPMVVDVAELQTLNPLIPQFLKNFFSKNPSLTNEFGIVVQECVRDNIHKYTGIYIKLISFAFIVHDSEELLLHSLNFSTTLLSSVILPSKFYYDVPGVTLRKYLPFNRYIQVISENPMRLLYFINHNILLPMNYSNGLSCEVVLKRQMSSIKYNTNYIWGTCEDQVLNFIINILNLYKKIYCYFTPGVDENGINTSQLLTVFISNFMDVIHHSFYDNLNAILRENNKSYDLMDTDDSDKYTDYSSSNDGNSIEYNLQITTKTKIHNALREVIDSDFINIVVSNLLSGNMHNEDNADIASNFIIKMAFLSLILDHSIIKESLTTNNHYILRTLMSSLKSSVIWNNMPMKSDINKHWIVKSFISSVSTFVVVCLSTLYSCLHITDRQFKENVAFLDFDEVCRITEIARHLAFYVYSNSNSVYFPVLGNSVILEIVTIYALTNLLRNIHLRDVRCKFFTPDFWEYDSATYDEYKFAYKELEKLTSNALRSFKMVNKRSINNEITPPFTIYGYEKEAESNLVLMRMSLDPLFGKDTSIITHPCFKERCFKDVEDGKKILAVLVYLPFMIPFGKRWTIFSKCMIIRYNPNATNISDFLNYVGTSQRPKENIVVRRKCLFEDGFTQMTKIKFDLRSGIYVTMIDENNNNEDGVDAGGIFKEFITDTLKLVTDPSYGLFSCNEYGDYYPNPSYYELDNNEEDYTSQYRFIGQLLGKCMFDGITANISFSPILLANLIGRNITIDDMKLFNEEMYNGLYSLIQMNKDEIDSCMLTFTLDVPTLEGRNSISLVPGGENINVDYGNRLIYVNLVVRHILCNQLIHQCSHIIEGLSGSIDVNWFSIFNELELYKAYGGHRSPIDLDDFKNNVHYEGYTPDSPTILMFWKVLEEMGQDYIGKLIKFSTGSPRPPILGFSQLVPKYCIKKSRPEKKNGFPESSACFNLLSLPHYDTIDTLKNKLSIAIESNTSFYAT